MQLNENSQDDETIDNDELKDDEAKSVASTSAKAKRKKKKKNKEAKNGIDSIKQTVSSASCEHQWHKCFVPHDKMPISNKCVHLFRCNSQFNFH